MMKHSHMHAPDCSPRRCSSAPLASCISVKAPDKPIEINLNVTIRQEVLVRLQRDVEQLINQNPQAFPQTAASNEEALHSGGGARVAAPGGGADARGRCGARGRRVGERYDGYIGVAAPVAAAVRSQVATINIQRRSLYSSLAASQGRQPAGCRHHRGLPAARARRGGRGLYAGPTARGGGARRAGGSGAGLLPLSGSARAVDYQRPGS